MVDVWLDRKMELKVKLSRVTSLKLTTDKKNNIYI